MAGDSWWSPGLIRSSIWILCNTHPCNNYTHQLEDEIMSRLVNDLFLILLCLNVLEDIP